MNIFYLSGIHAFELRDYQSAQTLLIQAIKDDTTEKEAYFYLAESYFLNDEYDEAIPILERYLEFAPKALDDKKNQAYALDLFGQCYMKKGLAEDALIKYGESLKTHPTASTYNNLSLYFIALAEIEIQQNKTVLGQILFCKAKKCIQEIFAICKAVTNPLFLHTLATWHEKYILFLEKAWRLSEVSFYFKEAIKYYQEAVIKCREDDAGLRNIIRSNLSQCFAQYGHNLYRNEHYREAMLQYSETLAIDSADLSALNQMGMCYSKQKHYLLAREFFKEILEVTEDTQELADAWLNITYTHRLEGSLEHAKKAITKAKNYAPEDEYILEEEKHILEEEKHILEEEKHILEEEKRLRATEDEHILKEEKHLGDASPSKTLSFFETRAKPGTSETSEQPTFRQ